MLEPDKYIIHCNKLADKYAKDILSGKIVSNKWIKLAIKRYQKDIKLKKWVKDQTKVDRVFKFFSYLNISIGGKYRQYQFIPFQAFIIKNLFLFYDKDGDRRYTKLFLYVARKNNKTVFEVCLNFYFLIADKEIDPQVLLLASTREQAGIILAYAKNIAKNSPALVKVKRQRYQLTYENKGSTGFMKTLASNANRLDGYNPNSAILDEVHAYPDDSLLEVIDSGDLARKNPLISLISTAGFEMESLCFELVEASKSVLEGRIKNDNFLCFIYTLDEKDDYENPKVWIKSNPALGTIIKLKKLKSKLNETLMRPSKLPKFLTKNLNIFTDSIEQWLEEKVLKKSFYDSGHDLTGVKCYGGLDLSSTKDLCAYTLLFEIDGLFILKPRFFFVNNKEKQTRKGGVRLGPWIDRGYITQMETKTLDYDLLFEIIEQDAAKYDIYSMGYDPFNSALIVPKIEGLGINCEPMRQTAMVENFPLKFMEKQFYDEKLCLSDNPVMLWNMRNIVIYEDSNGNIKIMKNKRNDSVDGAVATWVSFAGWIAENIDPEKAGLEAYLNN